MKIVTNGSARKETMLTAINAFIKSEHQKRMKLKSLNLTTQHCNHVWDVVSVNASADKCRYGDADTTTLIKLSV